VRFAPLRETLIAAVLLLTALPLLAQQPLATTEVNGEQAWTVNFKDAELEELVRFVAQVTGKTIVVDPKTKGRVQVISSQPLNRQQLYDLFLSILDVNGFAAVEAGNVVKIIPSRDARSAGAPVTAGGRETSEVVTEVIQLQNVAAATLIPVLRPLAPQQAHMAAYGPSNAIIVSDTAVNIARIREVIARIDKAAVASADVVRLQHASAEDMVRMLEQLEKAGAPQGQPDIKALTLVADKRTNSVLVSGDEMQRARIRALIRNLDMPLAQSGNARVIYLQYAKAKSVAEVLNKVLQNVEKAAPGQAATAGQGKAAVEADEGTNSLIITAPADIMSTLLNIVTRLDIRRAQVLVEAIIVEINARDGRDLGVQWLFLNDSGAYGSSSIGNGLNTGTAAAAFGRVPGDDDNESASGVDPRLALGQVIGNRTGQVLGIGRVGDNFSFNAVLNALQQNSDANILSTPSLLTLDNEEASIVVGQNVPFLTGSYTATGTGTSTPGNPFQTIERENVGITLKVTPHINDGDSLVLEIVQEVSSLTGAASTVNAADVITNQRKIETKVLANNGQTIVLGGLIQDDVQSNVTKVPLLGDIPGIGRLFRSNSTSKTKQHLMVFLRPIIVRDGRELDGATGEKYRYMRDLQLQERLRGVEFLREDQLPLLPEWQQQLDKLREMQGGSSGVIDLTAPSPMGVQP
jgi:general secretion pathway protein D